MAGHDALNVEGVGSIPTSPMVSGVIGSTRGSEPLSLGSNPGRPVVLLCSNCHMEFEDGLWQLDPGWLIGKATPC